MALLEREGVCGAWEGERERAEGCWGGGELGLTSGPERGMWHQVSARMTRSGDALADRPRVSRGLSAGGVTWQ